MSDARKPEIAVAMPAWNAGRFIHAAIESVLAQEGVTLELAVVDDASTDDTPDVVARFQDSRLCYTRNDRRRGIGYCHNLALRLTSAHLVAHVDADDVVLPGALEAMAEAARQPDVGQAFCDFYMMDDAGFASPESIARWKDFFRRQRSKAIDYRRDLLVHGMVVNHLRTYPRRVFERVGGFNEDLAYAVDYEMALRVAEHFRFVHVPRLLYAKRAHRGAVTEGMRLKSLRFWTMRRQIVRRRAQAQGGDVLGLSAARRWNYLAIGLLYALGAGQITRVAHALRGRRD
jgi:glycosyltransferase involved in cell wall biosynthesis